MTNYHLNEKTGLANICRAKSPDSCPIKNDDGTNTFHSTDKAEVQQMAEKNLSTKHGNVAKLKKNKTENMDIKNKYLQILDLINNSQDNENDRVKNGENVLNIVNERVENIYKAIEYADKIAPHKYDSKLALYTWLSKDLEKANSLLKKDLDNVKSSSRLKALLNKDAKAERSNSINKLYESISKNELDISSSKKEIATLIVSSELAKEGYILNGNISSVKKITSDKAIVKFVCDSCNKNESSVISSNKYISNVGVRSFCNSCGAKLVLQLKIK